MPKAVAGILLALLSFATRAQTVAASMRFEVADIQPSKPGTGQDFVLQPGGRLDVKAVSLKELVTYAYNVEDDMVIGAPPWLDTAKFDIVAKAPHSALETDSGNNLNISDAVARVMTVNLLADRFHFAGHVVQKEAPVYALIVGKHGHKLKPTAGGESNCRMQVIHLVRTYVCRNMTMQGLAERIRGAAAAYLDHPVVDLTQLSGAYDFSAAWTGKGNLLRSAPSQGAASGDPSAPAAAAPAIGNGMSVFDAFSKQLGLELVQRKHALPAVVIEHIDRTPTEN